MFNTIYRLVSDVCSIVNISSSSPCINNTSKLATLASDYSLKRMNTTMLRRHKCMCAPIFALSTLFVKPLEK